MGEVTKYIGVKISRDRVNHTISLSQQPYIDKIVHSNAVHDESAKPIPMQPQVDYNSPGDGTNKSTHLKASWEISIPSG